MYEIISELISVDLPGLFRSDGTIGGLIRNGTLILSNGEYMANTTIIITGGGSLVVGPNANITFAPDRGILVSSSGKFSVDGPSLLDSSNPPESWVGILLKNSNETYIRDAMIRNVENGVKSSSTGALVMINSTILNSYHGVFSSTGALVMINSTILNAYHGVKSSSTGALVMINSTILNAKYGVRSNYASNITLIDNVFEGNYRAVYIDRANYATIEKNKMTCKYQCLYLYSYYSSVSVNDNIIGGANDVSSSAQHLVYLISYMSQNDYLSLQDNSFGNWQTRPNYDALYVDIRQYSGGTGTVGLSNNRFYNISARHVFNLYFRSSETHVNVANLFESNLEALDSIYPSIFHIGDWPESCGDDPCSLVGNIFNYSLPPGQQHIAVPVSVEKVTSIDAELSYWGADDESSVIQSMFDGRDGTGLTTINYLPFLLTPDPTGDRR